MRASLPALLLIAACAGTGPGDGPDTATIDAACGQTFGAELTLEAQAAVNLCESDAAAPTCEGSDLLTLHAAMCAARKVDPRIEWSGGLYHDRLTHRTVWRMFGSLHQARAESLEHQHLLLDGRSGEPLEMIVIDRRESEVTLRNADGTDQPAPEFSGTMLLSGEGLAALDARVGKQYAEAYKLGAATITSKGGTSYEISGSMLAGNDELEVSFPAEVTVTAETVTFAASVDVQDKQLVFKLVAPRAEPPEK